MIYDDYCDNCPDYFDYDYPGDFDDVYGFIESVEYGMLMVFMDRMALVGRATRTGLDPVTRSPVLSTHLDRMIPVMETLSGPDSPGDPGEETDSHQTGFVDQCCLRI